MAFLDPVALLVFFGALGLAFGVGRLVRLIRNRSRASAPAVPMTRAERRRRDRGRR
jgi:hypothetical protein